MTATAQEWFPPDHEIPKKPSKYLRVIDGTIAFRFLAVPTDGLVAWSPEGAEKRLCVRKRVGEKYTLADGVDMDKISYFWMGPAIDLSTGLVVVVDITQKTVQEQIQEYSRNTKYGSPLGYDLTVKRWKEGNKYKFSTIADPPSPLDHAHVKAWAAVQPTFDMERIFIGGDPFGKPGENGNGAAPATPDDPRKQTLRGVFALACKIWPELAKVPAGDRSTCLKNSLESVGVHIESLGAASLDQLEGAFRALMAEENRIKAEKTFNAGPPPSQPLDPAVVADNEALVDDLGF